jgi:N-acetylglutamate synthase-like GNAT family acetyltransferase
MQIEQVTQRNDELLIAAAWIHQEWESADSSLEQTHEWCAAVARSTDQAFFVARTEGRVVGCALLVHTDLAGREDLSPWLSSVYVDPGYRRHRAGEALVARVEALAAALGHHTLYLYTDALTGPEAWYQRLGWRHLEDSLLRGRAITIMSKPLRQG